MSLKCRGLSRDSRNGSSNSILGEVRQDGFVAAFDQRPRCFLIETGPTPAALRPKRRRHALRRLWPGGARLRPQSDVEIGATSRNNRRLIERLNRSSIKRQSIDRPSFDSAWYMPTTWSSRALKRSFCLLSRRSLSRSNRPPSSRRRRAGIRTKRSD
jgi:hypothetical protein